MYVESSVGQRAMRAFPTDAEEVVGSLLRETGPLPQVRVSYETELKILWVTILPEPKPVFTLQVLSSALAIHRGVFALWGGEGAAERCPVKFIAYRGEGPVFTLGGDLDFYLDCLATNDRAGLQEYARVSIEGACWNGSSIGGLAITIATIHGKAMGGGIDAPRSCNLMVGERRASFAYPEVKFNHVPITAVELLSRHMGERAAKRVLMSGDEYSAAEFLELGGLDAVAPDGGSQEWVRAYARETLPIHAARTLLFSAFYRRAGDLRTELERLAESWTECMIRMAPTDISKLQRIARTQERMLSRMYR